MLMKKVFYLFVVIVLSSCITLPSVSYINTLDYRPLTDNGLFVTEANSVSFEYKAIGSLYAEETSSIVDGRAMVPRIENIYNNILHEAKKLGANGIINMSVTPLERSVVIKGMFIKREGYADINLIEEQHIVNTDQGAADVNVGEINDIEYTIFRETQTGVCISAERKLTIAEMKIIKEKLPVQKTLIQFYVLGQNNDKPYAGFSYNSFVDYEKKRMGEIHN